MFAYIICMLYIKLCLHGEDDLHIINRNVGELLLGGFQQFSKEIISHCTFDWLKYEYKRVLKLRRKWATFEIFIFGYKRLTEWQSKISV